MEMKKQQQNSAENALKGLEGQIDKAEYNKEPEEVIAIMKEVRRLLTDIRN